MNIFVRTSLVALAAVLGMTPGTAAAFSIGGGHGLSAPRWADGWGLEGGIDVGVEAGFASSLGAQTPAEIALVNQAVEDAFAAWETPELQFNIAFDVPVTIGEQTGFEVDLMALPASSPEWPPGFFFGRASVDLDWANRTLTNGTMSWGYLIIGADIFINIDAAMLVSAILPDDDARIAAITRLLMHEIGHAIGLQHADAYDNLDTDLDPTNPIPINPEDPLDGIIGSPNVPTDSIMTVAPCGAEYVDCPPLFYTNLTNDDIGGRNFLYPHVPEPRPEALALAALLLLGIRHARSTWEIRRHQPRGARGHDRRP